MAKKFENPLDAMAAMQEPSPPPSTKKSRRQAFVNPLEEVSDTDKAKAVGSSLVAGKYIRRTFTLTPGQLRRIREIAQELHFSETAVARWLLDEGIEQWDRGTRPEIHEQQQVKQEPKLRNW